MPTPEQAPPLFHPAFAADLLQVIAHKRARLQQYEDVFTELRVVLGQEPDTPVTRLPVLVEQCLAGLTRSAGGGTPT